MESVSTIFTRRKKANDSSGLLDLTRLLHRLNEAKPASSNNRSVLLTFHVAAVFRSALQLFRVDSTANGKPFRARFNVASSSIHLLQSPIHLPTQSTHSTTHTSSEIMADSGSPVLPGGYISLDMVTAKVDVSHQRRTKIVCTLGPASWSEEGISTLLDAGMNVARLNFSHGDHPGHQLVFDRLRKVAAAKNRNLASK